MIQIDIIDPTVRTKSGTAQRTGKSYTIREQEGWAFLFDRNGNRDPHPTKIVITLADDAQPHEKGRYELHPSSIYAGRFGLLEIGRLNLVPRKDLNVKSA